MLGPIQMARIAAHLILARIRGERGSTTTEHALVVTAMTITMLGAVALLSAIASGQLQCGQESWSTIYANC